MKPPGILLLLCTFFTILCMLHFSHENHGDCDGSCRITGKNSRAVIVQYRLRHGIQRIQGNPSGSGKSHLFQDQGQKQY